MKINLCPQRRDGTLTVSRQGDVLTVNGMLLDFSGIPEGATLPAEAVASEFVVGPVERIGGVLHVRLLLPHGPEPSQAVAFPVDIVDPPNGPVAVPFDPPAPEPEPEEA